MNSLKALLGKNRADIRSCQHESVLAYSIAGLRRSTCVECRHVTLARVGDGVSWEVEEWEEFTAHSH